jgi:hypothetical protein
MFGNSDSTSDYMRQPLIIGRCLFRKTSLFLSANLPIITHQEYFKRHHYFRALMTITGRCNVHIFIFSLVYENRER